MTVVIYFFDSDFKFFDDASEFLVTSLYVVFFLFKVHASFSSSHVSSSGPVMVSLVPCRSITTCASRLNYIHCCPSDLQRHCAWISAVMFHSSRRHDVKTTVAVLCLPSSGSITSSSVYCRQASLPSFRRQHTTTFHRTSLVRVVRRHARLSDSVSKHANFPEIASRP